MKFLCSCGCGEKLIINNYFLNKFNKNHNIKFEKNNSSIRRKKDFFEKNNINLKEIIFKEWKSFKEIANDFNIKESRVKSHFSKKIDESINYLCEEKIKKYDENTLLFSFNSKQTVEKKIICNIKFRNDKFGLFSRNKGNVYTNLTLKYEWKKIEFFLEKTNNNKIYKIKKFLLKEIEYKNVNKNDEEFIRKILNKKSYVDKNTKIKFI